MCAFHDKQWLQVCPAMIIRHRPIQCCHRVLQCSDAEPAVCDVTIVAATLAEQLLMFSLAFRHH